MSQNISRRRMAKGAAWAAPAVAIASAAPAASASPTTPIPVLCTATPTGSITGSKTYSFAVGTLPTYDPDSAGLSDKGTYYNVQLGQFQFNQPLRPDGTPYSGEITGYRMRLAGTAYLQSASGVKSTAEVVQLGTAAAQVIGAGLQQSVSLQTAIPYRLTGQGPANYLQNLSLPVCLTYLDGLTAVATASNECCFYLNVSYTTPKTDGGTAVQTATWSYSVAPLFA
ncbi:hypothetical protein [Falsarthrobacter nasiphocae]|uniref:Uncharacterized protein n=1 Tax=Falsarthrobacter nasiphocae TaxID=189863 RepID=A0AAE3YFV9_9MICC|nr:hypothetical protein [Falsarthrobacter nasiphocae]MDR6891992.1 hypothetical protein [Falsarthrobacter nasiphocae]